MKGNIELYTLALEAIILKSGNETMIMLAKIAEGNPEVVIDLSGIDMIRDKILLQWNRSNQEQLDIIRCVKSHRALTNMSLKESKEYVEEVIGKTTQPLSKTNG